MSTKQQLALFLSGMAVAGSCAAAVFFLGLGDSADPETPIYGIPGQYVPFTNLRPNNYDRLQIDVYADFTCPACQRLDTQGLGALTKRYGDRLRITRHYMATSLQASAAMVLYQLADGLGKGDVVGHALMSSNLKHAGDRVNLEAVRQIASRHGLLGQFDQLYASDEAKRRAVSEFRMIGHKISFFPFVVFENQIAAGGDVENLVQISDALLSNHPAPVRAGADASPLR